MLNRTQFQHIAEDVKAPGAGGTYDIKTGQSPKRGWVVATKGHEHIEPAKSFGVQSLEHYSRVHREALERTGNLGLWHEGGVGVYHDASTVYPPSYRGGVAALAGGQQGDQKAVQALHVGSKERQKEGGTTVYLKPRDAEERRDHRKGMLNVVRQRKGRDFSTRAARTRADIQAARSS